MFIRLLITLFYFHIVDKHGRAKCERIEMIIIILINDMTDYISDRYYQFCFTKREIWWYEKIKINNVRFRPVIRQMHKLLDIVITQTPLYTKYQKYYIFNVYIVLLNASQCSFWFYKVFENNFVILYVTQQTHTHIYIKVNESINIRFVTIYIQNVSLVVIG